MASGGGTDEDKMVVFAGAGEGGIFGTETVTGMNGVAAGAAGNVDQLVDAQIAFRGGCGADRISFVGEGEREGGTVASLNTAEGGIPSSGRLG